MTSHVEGNYMVFTTDHLCYFLITDKAQSDPSMLIIVIIASCVIAVSILIPVIVFVKKKKKRKPLQ